MVLTVWKSLIKQLMSNPLPAQEVALCMTCNEPISDLPGEKKRTKYCSEACLKKMKQIKWAKDCREKRKKAIAATKSSKGTS